MQTIKAFFVLLVLFSTTLSALDVPSLKLHNSHLKAVKLSSMKIDSELISTMATSTYELSFYNPNNQIIEGELNFSLLDSQSVIDYALEVDGKYRQASIVPKAKAKEAFEDVIRQNIDPAILEKTIGNNLKARLYPIPAKGYKKIKITIQELLKSKEEKTIYQMPFTTKDRLDEFSLNINFPTLDEDAPVFVKGMHFDKSSHGSLLRFNKSNIAIKKPISIAFDNPNILQSFRQTIKKTNFYFATMPFNFHPTPQKPPKSVAIVFNTSFSNRDRAIDKELAFLKAYLARVKNPKIEVIFFSNDKFKRKNIDINKQGYKALAKELKNAHYNGTSNFGTLNISKIKADEVLLLSNGIKTLYSSNPKKINKPIIAINASLNADTKLLKYYAKISDGHFIDLIQQSPQEAIETLQQSRPKIRIIHSKGIAKNESFIEYSNNEITVFTRSRSSKASLILEYKEHNQTLRKTIHFKNALPVKAHLPTLWASKRIQALSVEYDKNRAIIDRLAKFYKVVTKDMSMIVLERVSDYVKYKILPPKELQKAYYTQLSQRKNEKLYEKEQSLIESIKLLEEQKQWYKRKFPKTKRPQDKFDTHQGSISDEEGGDIAPVMMAEPTPAPIEEKSKKSKSKKEVQKSKKLEIALKSFDPDTLYLKKLKELKKHQWLYAYEMMKTEYIAQPMYYVDVASFLYKKQMKRIAIRILSNVIEMDFDNSEFLRIFAFKAMEMKEYTLAIKAYERVKNLRPFEPQSYRDLALAYSKAKQYSKAVKSLYYILLHTWDSRFNGIKIVVINEMNAIITKHHPSTKGIDKRLIAKMPVDFRVVINWSGDNSDMDLWVTDPHGEKTYYSNKLSYIGGKISNDIIGGYGPEEFMIKDAIKGEYKIEVNYYGSSSQKTTIPVTIRAEVYTHYGKKAQKGSDIVVRVGNQSQVVEVGEIRY